MRFVQLLSALLLASVFAPAQAFFCYFRSHPRLITINPPTLIDPTPLGYSHITVDTRNAVATVAGQVALDKDGNIVGTTLQEQLLETEKALNLILQALDADVEDIFKLNAYIADFDVSTDLAIYQPTGVRLGRPPSTLIAVPSLALEGLLVEIEVSVALSKKFVRDLVCGRL